MKSKLIQHYSQLLDNMAGYIEAFYVYPMPQRLCQSCTKNIDGNAANLQHLPLEITADSNHLQAKIGKCVLAQYHCDPLAEVLHRRLQPLLAFPLPLPAVQDWLTVIPSAPRRIPGFAQVGFCRSLFSAWNTKARYGARDERCQWCNIAHGVISNTTWCALVFLLYWRRWLHRSTRSGWISCIYLTSHGLPMLPSALEQEI